MKIVTDSAADLPPGEAESLDISVAPLLIQFPEGEVSSDHLTPDEFYTRLIKMEPHIPTTSQPSAGYFAELYDRLNAGGEEVLSIHISSGLSGTIESARLGVQRSKTGQVTPFDSLTLSGGERFMVWAAARAAHMGAKKEEILSRLEKIRSQNQVIFTLETLKYLARGGRIGRVQAMAGTLLNLKPVIAVDKKDGKYNNLDRVRTIGKALETVVEKHREIFGAEKGVWVTVLHGQLPEAANRLSSLFSERMRVMRLEILRVSPVLGVHTGPGVIGAAVLPYELVEDLV